MGGLGEEWGRWFTSKQINHLSAGTGASADFLESTRQLSGQRSKRLMPNTASCITRSLMRDGVPSENSEVGINFVFGSKVKSKSRLISNSVTHGGSIE